jgi:hypothetical protein
MIIMHHLDASEVRLLQQQQQQQQQQSLLLTRLATLLGS